MNDITNKKDIRESQEFLWCAEDMIECRRQRVERFGLTPGQVVREHWTFAKFLRPRSETGKSGVPEARGGRKSQTKTRPIHEARVDVRRPAGPVGASEGDRRMGR